MRALFNNPYAKGQYPYLAYRKKQQLTAALICLFIVVAFVVAGLLIFKDRKNVLMIPGVLMVLPMANFLVTWLALAGSRPLGEEKRKEVQKYEDAGMGLYHLFYVDERGRRQYMDHVTVYRNAVVAYCSKIKADRKVPVETDCILRFKKKNISLRLKIFTSWEDYRERLEDVDAELGEDDVNRVENAREALLGMCL